MKVSFLSTVLSLAIFVANTAAWFSLDPFPDVVYVGESYTVSWTASANYTYNIWLILENPGNPYTWTNGTSLGSALRFQSLKPNFTWSVPANLNTSRFYGLWIDAFPIRFDGSNLNNQTDWFAISTNKPASTTSSSASASGTASATTSVSSSVASSTSSSAPSSGGSSSSHTSLSGGAIAGIVIGCLVVIALTIGGYLFYAWRKKKTAKAEREAAQRASRLEPVMQTGYPSYEMHGRGPQANKEVTV